MRDMSAVDPRAVSYTAPPDAHGDQVLSPRIEDGVKVFDLDAGVIKWNILPRVQVMAHTHKAPDRQQALGLYGALIIDPKTPPAKRAYDLEHDILLQEWLQRQGYTYPAMLTEGTLPNYFTINGKAYPATDTITMRVGQRVQLRFIGSHNNFVHPMHVHAGPFTIVETDGSPVPAAAQPQKDTVDVGPGERYGVIWTAREPGRWLLHCHIPHHTTNNNVEERGGGGLTVIINVRP